MTGLDASPNGYYRKPLRTNRAPCLAYVFDFCCLRDRDAHTPGFYLAVSATSVDSIEGTHFVWFAHDGEDFFHNMGPIRSTVPLGHTLDKLEPPGDVTAEGLDAVNTVDIFLQGNGFVEPTTDAGVLAESNKVIIGNELLSFRDATPLARKQTWQLSTLKRGLRATDDQQTRHFIGERVILVSEKLRLIPLDAAFIGERIQIRVGPTADTATAAVEFFYEGYNARPLRPTGAQALRADGDDLTFSWTRESRVSYPQAATDKPLPEVTESYDVVIDSDHGTGAVDFVNRTLQTDQESVTYTTAQQTDDGLEASDFQALIYQRDSTYGRGRPAVLDVPAPTP